MNKFIEETEHDPDVGAGVLGIMFGVASDVTEKVLPLMHLMATRLGRNGPVCAKTVIAGVAARCHDAGDDRVRSATVVISTQQVEPLKAVRSMKVLGCCGLGI